MPINGLNGSDEYDIFYDTTASNPADYYRYDINVSWFEPVYVDLGEPQETTHLVRQCQNCRTPFVVYDEDQYYCRNCIPKKPDFSLRNI